MLDATALTTAAFTGNTNTASSISMLLTLGEEIEDVTKRVSYGNLALKLLISDEPVHILENDEEKTIPAEALKKGDLVIVRQGLISKTNQNNAFIIEVNSALLILGVMGLITPQLAAILHNSVTVGISMKSMQNILG